VLILAACGATAPASSPAVRAGSPGTTVFPAAARAQVPEVTGRTLEGRPLALRQLSGSGVVVINVWASWCTSCRAESAALAVVAAQLSGSPVHFLGIDEEDSPSAARTFLAGSGIRYPQVADPDGDVLRKLSLLPQSGIPSTLLLDSRGRMAARVIGPVTQAGLSRLLSSLR
jgi:thiol-disulfide isomerase/thioredoxin